MDEEKETKNAQSKEAGKEIAENVVRGAGSYIGGKPGEKFADLAMKTPYGKHTINNAANKIGKADQRLGNPLGKINSSLRPKPPENNYSRPMDDESYQDDSSTEDYENTENKESTSNNKTSFSDFKINKKKLKIIGISIGAVMLLSTIIIGMSIFYAPIEAAIKTVGITAERTLNFLTGNGFYTEQESFDAKLINEYKLYNSNNNKIGDLDVALIAMTLHYGKLVNPELWSGEKISDDIVDNKFGFKDVEITGSNAKSFYKWAGNWIGTANTFKLDDRRLMGALVSTKAMTTCGPKKSIFEDILNTGSDLLVNTAASLFNTVSAEVTDAMKFILLDWISQEKAANDTIGTSEFELALKDMAAQGHNIGYDLRNILDLSGVDKNLQCSGKTTNANGDSVDSVPTTLFMRFNDYDKYKNYLRSYYIPTILLECGNCQYKDYKWKDGERDKKIESIINEIFKLKDEYNLIAGLKFDDVGSLTTFQPGAPSLPLDPLPNNTMNITSTFGEVRYINGIKDVHRGIDFARPQGTPIKAVGDGVVVATTGHYSYGNVVTIGHDTNGDGKYDFYSLYGHMFQKNVIAGQQIGGGQTIGLVGSTGNSTGNHLHLEILDANKKLTDPLPTLKTINPNVTYK